MVQEQNPATGALFSHTRLDRKIYPAFAAYLVTDPDQDHS